MDWKELQVRLGQEFHKRADLLKHQVGLGAGTIRLSPSSGQPAHFFFPPADAQNRAQLLQTHLPNEASAIIREADEICAHRFRLLGYENLDYGPEIDWHLDRVHNKRAPLDPWFKIPFLDFSIVGDHKVTWELNRHQHFVTLAKARLLSGDDKYSHELHNQFRGWLKANPYPLGINWGSSLEVAFRSLSWIWFDHLLADTPNHRQFRIELLPALAFDGRYIERYLSTYFSPNTHLLGEAVALFFLGTLYPEMPHAARWKNEGWKIILHEAKRQVRPDGVYFEQSLHYHVYALDFFLYARQLAALNAIEIPASYDAILQRMIDVVAALAQAGPPEGFGDDDGGRIFNPRRNRTEQTTDPLATGSLVYARKIPTAQLTEESIWLFGQTAIENLSTAAPLKTAASPKSIAFRDGGIYVLAADQPFPTTIAVDAGPQGIGRSGHGHADALSLRLALNGERWLVDSGSGVYISKDPADRDTFRGTGAHNTLRVDGVDQAITQDPFSWTNIPSPQAEEWIAARTFTYFVGSHNGYARLADPVIHRRHVIQIADGPCLIRDIVIGQTDHDLELRWHFAPDLNVQLAAPARIEISRSSATGKDPALSMIVPSEAPWAKATGISRTLLSPAYGAYQPAPLVRSQVHVKLPTETATILLSHPAAARKDQYRLTNMPHAAVQVYELDRDDESHAFFFALGSAAWSFGPWSSDARLLYCRIHHERLVHLIAVGGTHVAWKAQNLIAAQTPAEFFEWRRGDAMMNQGTGQFSPTALFHEMTKDMTSDAGNRSSSGQSRPYAEKH